MVRIRSVIVDHLASGETGDTLLVGGEGVDGIPTASDVAKAVPPTVAPRTEDAIGVRGARSGYAVRAEVHCAVRVAGDRVQAENGAAGGARDVAGVGIDGRGRDSFNKASSR